MRIRHLKVCSFPQMGMALTMAAGLFFAGIQANAADLVWDNGSGDSLWNTTSTNWSGIATWSNSVPDNATFTATGAGAVTLGEAITAGTVNITAGDYTFGASGGSLSFTTLDTTAATGVGFNGVLAGSGTITSAVNGDWFNNNSAFNGTINHSAGAITINSANSVGTGTLNLTGGNFANDNGTQNLNSSLVINATGGSIQNFNSPNRNLGITGTLNLNSGGSGVSIGGNFDGRGVFMRSTSTLGGDAGSVTINGGGFTIESGATVTYTGGFLLNAAGPNRPPKIVLGDGIDLSSTGSNNTITFGGNRSDNTRSVDVSDGGTATIGTVNQNETTDGLAQLRTFNNSTLNVSGVISGQDITIAGDGSGTTVFTGNNTYSGTTAINNGTLQLAETGSLACNVVNVLSGATFDVHDGYTVTSGKTISGAGTLRASGDIGFESGSSVTINTLEVTGGDTQSNLTSTSISRLAVSGGSVTLSGAMDWSEIEIPEGSTGIVSVAAAGVSTDTLTIYGDGALRASDYVLTINAGGSIYDYANYAVIAADLVNGLTLQGTNLASTVEARTFTLGGGTAIITALPNVNESYTLNYDAGVDTDSNGAWESTTALQTLNWALGANIARTTTLSGAASGITAAYDFPTSGSNNDADKATTGTFNGPVAVNADSTWEFWLQADDLSTDQTLWESGGSSDGSGLVMKSDGTILFIAKNGGASAVVTNMFPTDGGFHQVMVTLDMDASGTTDILKMYIDGTLVDTDDSQTGVDNWAGGDGAGLGGYGGGDTGGTTGAAGDISYGTFDGRFAIMRFYEGAALSDSQVLANYQAVNAPGVNLANTDIHINADSTINLSGAGAATLGELSFDSFDISLTVTNDTYDAVSDLVQQWGSQGGIGYTEYNTGGDSYAVFRKLMGGTVILVN